MVYELIVVCARWSSLCCSFSLNCKFGDDFNAANLSKVIRSITQEESFLTLLIAT